MIEQYWWVSAPILLLSGLLLGEMAGRMVRGFMAREHHSVQVRDMARAAGSAMFWSGAAIGLFCAAAAGSPSTVDDLGQRIGDTLPDAAIAATVVLAGYALAMGASAAFGQSIRMATGVRHPNIETAIKWSIVLVSLAIAGSTMGASAELMVLVLVTAAIGPILSAALLSGLGGREVAASMAAGRALRSQLHVGEWLSSSLGEGTVVALHSTSVEIECSDAEHRHIAYSALLERSFGTRPTRSSATSSG